MASGHSRGLLRRDPPARGEDPGRGSHGLVAGGGAGRFATVVLDGNVAGREAGDGVATRLAKAWWSRIVHLAEGEQPDTVDRAGLGRRLGRG
jgi:hypothetical protein